MENNLKNTINNIVNKIFNKSLDVEPLILLSDDLPLIKKLNDSIIINDYTVFINSLTPTILVKILPEKSTKVK